MCVRLAVQTFSNSVADALEYLSLDAQLHEFANADAIIKFCRVINNLFDIFNSRNNLCKYHYKKRLSRQNAVEIFNYLDFCAIYLTNIKLRGQSILQSRKKTGFLGFLVGIKTLKCIYDKYIGSEMPLLIFLPTYKLSQDHLEVFFSCLRSRGGFNNNLTARQLEASYRRLIVHAEIKGSDNVNNIALDATSILHVSSSNIKVTDTGESMREYDDFAKFTEITELYHPSDMWHLTTYIEDIVGYIAGFVVHRLKNVITCNECFTILQENEPSNSLTLRKSRGVFHMPQNLLLVYVN